MVRAGHADVARRCAVLCATLFLFALVPIAGVSAQVTIETGQLVVSVHDPRAAGVAPFEEFHLVRADGSAVRIDPARLPVADQRQLRSLQGQTVTMVGTRATVVLPGETRALTAFGATTLTRRSTTSMAALTAASGAYPFAVVMCRFSDMPTVTPASASTVAQWTASQFPGADNYWRDASGNRMSLGGTQTFGWFDLAKTYDNYYGNWQSRYPDSFTRDVALRDDCLSAAGAAINVSAFAGIAIQHNGSVPYSYAYYSPISLTRNGITKSYKAAFMADWAAGPGNGPGVYAHEIGHTFGLQHSGGGYGLAYDSKWDVMSVHAAGQDPTTGGYFGTHTIAWNKDQLGWIPANRKLRFDSDVSGTIAIERTANPGAGNLLYAEIPILNEPGKFYSLEYRQRVGDFEAALPLEGIVIHKVDPSFVGGGTAPGPAQVVDVDLNGNPNDDAAVWTVGETFTNAAAGIAVSVVANLGTALRLNVIPGIMLTVRGAGAGSGTVSSASGVSYAIGCTINAGSTSGACARFYHPAESVTLTAVANSGSAHTGWQGACTGGAGTTCQVAMSQIQDVTALFGATSLATRLGVLTQPAGAVSGAAFTTQPVIELRDANDAPVLQSGTTVTASMASGTGVLIGTLTATTSAEGRATFSNLGITGSGAHTLTFSASGLTSVASVSVLVAAPVAPTATRLAMAREPAGAVSGVSFVTQPAVDLNDANNQVVAQAGVTVTASKATGPGTLGGTLTAITDAQGRATFTNLVINGIGSHAISFGAAGLASVTSANFTVAAAPATQLAMVTQPGGAVSGFALTAPPEVELRDANNVAVQQAGVLVTVGKASGAGVLSGTVTASTDASGKATFATLILTGIGAHALTFSATGLSSATSASFTVTPAPAAQLTMATQPGGAVSGFVLAIQPSVQLRDAANQVVAESGIVVSVAKASGSGILSGILSAPTDANGNATFASLVLTGTGAHTLNFSAAGLTGVTSATVTVTAASATHLAMVTQPGGAVSGFVLTAHPSAELRDANNVVVQQGGVVVTVAKASGAGVLTGTFTATTDANGLATFTNLAITGTGSHSLNLSAPGLIDVSSASFNVSAAPATQLTLTTQPAGAVSGSPFATQPALQLRDAANQAVAEGGVVVAVTKASGAGAIAGTLNAITDATGKATFTNLLLTGNGAHALSFSANGLTGATSASFIVSVAPATQLAVVTQPGGAVSGMAFSAQPTVELRDANNAVVPQAGVLITVLKASGAGTLTGTLSATTDATGKATFSNLALTGTGVHTLQFGAPGLTGVTSASVTVTSADLIAGTPTVTPPNPLKTQAIAISATVSNVGNATATNVAWQLKVDGAMKASGVIGTLGAGENTSVGAVNVGPYAEGQHTAQLVVDPDNAVPELSDANNVSVMSFTVSPAPLAVRIDIDGAPGRVLRSASGTVACALVEGVTQNSCTVPLTGPEQFTAESTPVSGFIGWGGACTGRAICTVVGNETQDVRAMFIPVKAIAADVAARDLLTGTGLADADRELLDKVGNADGVYNLGDLLAHLDRTNQVLSAALAAQILSAPKTLSQPIRTTKPQAKPPTRRQ